MNSLKLFILVFFSVPKCLFSFGVENDSVLFCHDTVWQETISTVTVLQIYGDHCSYEKLKKLTKFQNVRSIVFNSYPNQDFPFDLDFPYLEELVFINCPNLNYETILKSVENKEKIKKNDN